MRRLFRHPATHALLGLGLRRDKLDNLRLDQDLAQLQRQLDAALPGMVVSVIDRDNEAKRIIVSAIADRSPPAYYLFDRDKAQLQQIKNSATAFPPPLAGRGASRATRDTRA